MFLTRRVLRFISAADLKPPICYYKTLNLSTSCTVDEIRSSYLELAKRFHPDINREPNAADKFRQIQKAYQILSEQQTRSDYDAANKIQPEKAKKEPEMTDEQMAAQREYFRKKYIDGEENKRKDILNDQFNFSYGLMKKHFEKVQSTKADYTLYVGTGGQNYYARLDEKPQPLYRSFMFVIVPSLTVLAWWLWPSSKQHDNKQS